jgi:hypothetical protein
MVVELRSAFGDGVGREKGTSIPCHHPHAAVVVDNKKCV